MLTDMDTRHDTHICRNSTWLAIFPAPTKAPFSPDSVQYTNRIVYQKAIYSKTSRSSSNIMNRKMINLYLSCFISFLLFFHSLLKFRFRVSGFLRSSLLFLFIGHNKYAQEQTGHIKGKPEADHNKKYHVDLPWSIKDLWRGWDTEERENYYLSLSFYVFLI